MLEALDFNHISFDQLQLPLLRDKKIELDILRLDKIHPIVSGNKWFKLRFYIDEAIQLQKTCLVTFGGAYSNHIIATAAACRLHHLSSIGIIRGEEPAILSPTLQQARQLGMKLYFISREDYAAKKIPPELVDRDCYIVNEGGYGPMGALGAATLLDDRTHHYAQIFCAVGTGTMMAGLMNAAQPMQVIAGISVLKNNLDADASVRRLLHDQTKNITLYHAYHFGGYAKHTPALIRFMNDFYDQTAIPLDFVYTAKLLYGTMDLIQQDHFPPNTRLLVVHSGGLQGNTSLSKGTLNF